MAALCVVSRIHENDRFVVPRPRLPGMPGGFPSMPGQRDASRGGSQPRKTIFKKSPEAGFKMIKRVSFAIIITGHGVNSCSCKEMCIGLLWGSSYSRSGFVSLGKGYSGSLLEAVRGNGSPDGIKDGAPGNIPPGNLPWRSGRQFCWLLFSPKCYIGWKRTRLVIWISKSGWKNLHLWLAWLEIQLKNKADKSKQ